MPAGLPGSTVAANVSGNPSAGQAVLIDALSGPKGSLLDRAGSVHASTGAMSTGIGYGLSVLIGQLTGRTIPQSIRDAGFNDDSGEGVGANSTGIYIGGGKCTATVNGRPPPVPYTAGFLPCGAGNGGSRDGGTAGRGFIHKMVTAVGGVNNGVAIETGWINRTGVAMVATQSAFGSSLTEQAALA